MDRRSFLRHVGGGATLVALHGSSVAPGFAQDRYPSRAVTIVNPFAPGSISDAAARLIAQYLQDGFGQPFIIENKVGAGGLLAATTVQRAAPDGYTLLLTASSAFSGAALYKSLPFDPVKDFRHIARIGSFHSFLAANPSLPVGSVAELVAYAKVNPGKLSYGHGNNMGQIVGESFKKRTGADIVRVAYRSNPAAVTDLIAGHIQLMVPDLNTGLSHVQGKRIRALAVFTRERSPAMPDVPTLDETVMPGFELLPWCGISGPVSLPPDIVTRLAGAVQKALASSDGRKRFEDAGVPVFFGGPDEFEAYVAAQLANWTTLIKEAGIQPE